MGSDADSGSGGNSTGTSSGSENSGYGASNPSSSANLDSNGNFAGREGQSYGSFDSAGNFSSSYDNPADSFDWGGFLDNVKSFMSTVSLATSLGLNPAVAVPAYAAYKTFSYAWSNRNNPSVHPGPPAAAPTGIGTGFDANSASKQYQSNQQQVRSDWANYLADISARTRVRGANQPTSFTSLLED